MTRLTSQNRVLPARRPSPRLVTGATQPHAWGAALSSESTDLQRQGRRSLPGSCVTISIDSRFKWPAPADSVRGRFHAVCLAIHMKVPFLAVSAPTSKTVNLLSEGAAEWTRTAGFSQARNKALRICSITSRRSLTPSGDCF